MFSTLTFYSSYSHNPTCYCAMMYIKKQEKRISERDLSLNELEIPSQQSLQRDGLYIKRGIIYIFYFHNRYIKVDV